MKLDEDILFVQKKIQMQLDSPDKKTENFRY